jgi:hypothetical protein
MADQSPENRLLDGILRAILDSGLTPSERLVAAKALRTGKLLDCVLGVLEFQPSGEGPRSAESEPSTELDNPAKFPEAIKVPKSASISDKKKGVPDANELFDILRRRKISKIKLMSMIERLSFDVASGIDVDAPMRETLREFKKLSTEAEWVTLSRMISGEIEGDSYVRNILDR